MTGKCVTRRNECHWPRSSDFLAARDCGNITECFVRAKAAKNHNPTFDKDAKYATSMHTAKNAYRQHSSKKNIAAICFLIFDDGNRHTQKKHFHTLRYAHTLGPYHLPWLVVCSKVSQATFRNTMHTKKAKTTKRLENLLSSLFAACLSFASVVLSARVVVHARLMLLSPLFCSPSD